MAIPTVRTGSLGGDDEDLAGSDQVNDLRAEDVEITEESRAANQDEDALNEGAWTEESEENDPESDLNDDASLENVEITEGGWICRVERFEKHVDSHGHITYHHAPKESSPPLVNRDLRDAPNAETLEPDPTESDSLQSIISYFHHTVKSITGSLIEPEIYIEIKSPLIIEVLRQAKSYRV